MASPRMPIKNKVEALVWNSLGLHAAQDLLHRDHLHLFRRMFLSPESCNNRRICASKIGSVTTHDAAWGDEDTQKAQTADLSVVFAGWTAEVTAWYIVINIGNLEQRRCEQ